MFDLSTEKKSFEKIFKRNKNKFTKGSSFPHLVIDNFFSKKKNRVIFPKNRKFKW